MEDLKTQRISRFQNGSEEAKEFMSTLRSRRGGNIPMPTTAELKAEPRKLKPKKDIIVAFS